MRRLLAPAAAVFIAVLGLPALAQAPGFGFTDRPPITLDVAEVVVESRYVPPLQEPHVDHLIPVTPTDAVRLWAQDRLRAGGTEGTARIVITDASVKEEALERTGGVRGWFTKDQSERYAGRLSVELVVEVPGRGLQGTTTAAVSRSTTVPEDVSLAEREKVMLELVRNMVRDLDGQLDPAIRRNLSPAVLD